MITFSKYILVALLSTLSVTRATYHGIMLINAIYKGDKQRVQELIKNGIRVDARDPQDRTALIATAANNHKDIAELLLKHGAHVNAQDEDGRTALIMAIVLGRKDMVEFLLKHGADVTIKDNNN